MTKIKCFQRNKIFAETTNLQFTVLLMTETKKITTLLKQMYYCNIPYNKHFDEKTVPLLRKG